MTKFADEYNVLYLNQGGDDFRDVSYDAGVAVASLPWVKWGTAFVDLDNDGWLDLISVNGQVYPQVDQLPSGARYRQPKNLFMNERNGNFCDARAQAGEALQILMGTLSISPHQSGAPALTTMSFVLTMRSGVPMFQVSKSRKLFAGGMTQTAEIFSGGSYLSNHDFRVHFGLNDATKIDSLEIKWPSGKVETIKDLKADQFYSVLEGSGIVDREKIVPKKK